MNGHRDRHRWVGELATRQHGVVTRPQLLAGGLSDDTIEAWLRAGRLITIHRGVYAVGHEALSQRARWIAAVFACGPTAVLSHGSAAALWELADHQPNLIHVTVRTHAGLTAPRGVRLHRYRSLVEADITTRHGIPVTTPSRTALDLSPVLRPRALRRLIAQADVLRLLDFSDIERLLDAHPRRPGARRLNMLLAEHRPDPELARSELEIRFLELCDRADLPEPRVNQRVEGIEVDFHWPAARVAVEADGYAFHRTRAAFERDRERDAVLSAAGYRVHRFTDRQIKHRPETVVAALRRSLSS